MAVDLTGGLRICRQVIKDRFAIEHLGMTPLCSVLIEVWLLDLRLRQFVRYFVGIENLSQHFPHPAHVNRDRTINRFIVVKAADQRLDVAVKDQADKLRSLLIVGEPLLPPVMSLVATKLNGVFRLTAAFRSIQRCGKT